MEALDHAAVTLAADADTILSLSTQEIGLDTQTANYILAGPTAGVPADPTFRAMVAADLAAHTHAGAGTGGQLDWDDVWSDAAHNHSSAGEGGAVDASVVTYTPAVATDWDSDADPGDVDNALDQLAERVDDLEGAAGHAAVTLAADADTVLSLSTQEIGFDTQTANYVFAGPSSGAAADPTFRTLVRADMPAGIAFSAHKNGSAQTIGTGSYTKVTFTTELFDLPGYYDDTNSKFVPPLGYYLITAFILMDDMGDGKRLIVTLYKNGAVHAYLGFQCFGAAVTAGAGGSAVVYADGDDYFEIYVYHDYGSDRNVNGTSYATTFTGCKVA